MNQPQEQNEIQFLKDALTAGKAARVQYMSEVRAGWREAKFTELRQLDMDIEKVEKELKNVI